MKKIALVAAAFALTAGVAGAAGFNAVERPDTAVIASDLTKVEVSAKEVVFPKELSRANLSADQAVSVTLFPSTGEVDRRGRD